MQVFQAILPYGKGKDPVGKMRAMTGTRQVRAVILDMDNTLFDLVGAKYAACRAIAGEAGCGTAQQLFSYFLRNGHGFEDPSNIRDFLLDSGVSDADLALRCIRIYHEVKLACIEPYPEVRETLASLRERGLPLALVTDALRADAAARLGKTGLAGFFDHIVTHEATWQKKPSPLPFQYALGLLGIPPAEVIAVGDSPRRDIAPCRQLGMVTLYARYGDRFGRQDQTGGADFAIDSPAGILAVLDGRAERETRARYPCAADSHSP